MNNVRSMEELAPLITATVEAGGEFLLVTRGTSMRPLLRDGKDTAVLVKPPVTLRKGDVPLYRRDNGQYVLHRLMRVHKNGTFDAMGDNQTAAEKGIPTSAVIAVMTAVLQDNVRTDFDSPAYRKYQRKLPILRLRNRLSQALRRHSREE